MIEKGETAKLEAAVDKVLMKLFVFTTPPSILGTHTNKHIGADNCEKLMKFSYYKQLN